MNLISLKRLRQEVMGLWSWWTNELCGVMRLLTTRIAPALATRVQIYSSSANWEYGIVRGRRCYAIDADGVAAEVERRAHGIKILRHKLRGEVGLTAHESLSLSISLPLAAERALNTAVPLRLQRELPLHHDRYLIDWEVIARDRAAQQIRIQCWVAHRDRVAEGVEKLQALGLRPTRVGLHVGSGLIHRNFLRQDQDTDHHLGGFPRRWAVRVACAQAALLCAITAGQWIVERREVERIAGPLHIAAARMRANADAIHEGWQPIVELYALSKLPDAANVLLALTDAVPTYAWIYEATIEPREGSQLHVQLTGIAPRGDAVAQALEGTPVFRNVALTNTVLLVPDHEHFQITADYEERRASPTIPATAPLPSNARLLP